MLAVLGVPPPVIGLCDSLRHFSHFSQKYFEHCANISPQRDTSHHYVSYANISPLRTHFTTVSRHINQIDKINKADYFECMKQDIPETAYSLLEPHERHIVDEYVEYAIGEQNRKRERIVYALSLPIPHEYIRRSKSALYKPLLRAAVSERLKSAADLQDISPDKVIGEHAQIAFSNISDYIESTGFGDFRVKSLDGMPKEKMGAVKSIETKPGMYGLATKVVLHDKHPSLKALGELMGLVAPDNTPALYDYVKPPEGENGKGDVPEDVYMELLDG